MNVDGVGDAGGEDENMVNMNGEVDEPDSKPEDPFEDGMHVKFKTMVLILKFNSFQT